MSQPASPPSHGAVVIAGGGIIGMTIAWRLAQKDVKVAVFDQSEIGGEASWAGAGMLALGGELEGPSQLASLAIESRQLYPDFIRELEEASGAVIDFQQRGAIELAYSADEQAALEKRVAGQEALGIESKPLLPVQVASFWPRVRQKGLMAARFYPGDAVVNPREVMQALSAACQRLGVLLFPRCAIKHAAVSAAGVDLHTDARDTRCETLIIAAGAWSSSISIKGVPVLPLAEPVRGHLIGYRQRAHTCETIIRRGHTYLLQRANGLLIAGASAERVGFDRHVDPQIAASLASQAQFVLPHLAETAPSEAWIGFRPGSPNLETDVWHSDRLHLAYGHYRNGILLAPVTAQKVAAAVIANLGKR